MKKTLTLVLLTLTVWACHRKSIPSDEIILSNKNDTSSIKEPPVADAFNLAAQGKTVYTNRCARCHGLKNTENYTSQKWENILRVMIPKARLNDEEAKQVTAYVMANSKK
jgi:mono/diheme cytochrome c family protein